MAHTAVAIGTGQVGHVTTSTYGHATYASERTQTPDELRNCTGLQYTHTHART